MPATRPANNQDPLGKHYNKDFYSEIYDINDEMDQDVRFYGREMPAQLDYA